MRAPPGEIGGADQQQECEVYTEKYGKCWIWHSLEQVTLEELDTFPLLYCTRYAREHHQIDIQLNMCYTSCAYIRDIRFETTLPI